MPIYEYQCKSCGHRLEVIQGFDDAPLTDCPDCHTGELAKLLSAPAFHLKGTGWYATDFKNPPACKQAAAPVANGDTTSGGTGECKTAAKKTDEKTPPAK